MPFLGNTPSNTFVSIAKQTIVGNGNTTYVLSYPVTSANDIEVVVNNIQQEPTVAYTATGTSITFTEALKSTDSAYVLFNGQAIATIAPTDGSVGTTTIADGAITSSKIADGAVTSTDLASTLDLSSKTVTLPAGNVTFSQMNTPGTISNPFKSVAHAQFFGVTRGLYYFTNGTNTQQLYYDHADGGWLLAASSNASDTTIPGGTSRNSTSYYINRNGTFGHLGTPSPNSDYLIGSWLDNYKFTKIRGIGFGRGSTNNTYTWPSNLGVSIECQWACESYTQIVNKAYVSVQITSDGSGLPPGATYFIMDAIRMDYVANGVFDANPNQSTIGWAAVTNANGDPVGGTYLGHGSGEGSFEGWYNAANAASDCQGWTTWVR